MMQTSISLLIAMTALTKSEMEYHDHRKQFRLPLTRYSRNLSKTDLASLVIRTSLSTQIAINAEIPTNFHPHESQAPSIWDAFFSSLVIRRSVSYLSAITAVSTFLSISSMTFTTKSSTINRFS